MKLRIAMIVPGRFYAFDLARELIKRGHEVTLFTNYPKRMVVPFGVPASAVRSLWLQGASSKLNGWLRRRCALRGFETALHLWFGRWAAGQVVKKPWDAVICWSGVAEESFRVLERAGATLFLVRSSAHVRAQAQILEEEEIRSGSWQERPSPWMIAREEREYRLADCILVPSSFARDTFLQWGFLEKKIRKNLLGVQVSAFRPEPAVVEARCERILSGRPLRVLFVGTLSFRKGLLDALEMVRRLYGEPFEFRFLGPRAPGVETCVAELSRWAEVVSKQPEEELPRWYARGDLFLFPTLEDGYAVVLDQALSGGLPVLATAHCAAPDLIQEGVTGWILPIRRPDAFIDRLRWCQDHRKELAQMVRTVYKNRPSRDWADMANELEKILVEDRQDFRLPGAELR